MSKLHFKCRIFEFEVSVPPSIPISYVVASAVVACVAMVIAVSGKDFFLRYGKDTVTFSNSTQVAQPERPALAKADREPLPSNIVAQKSRVEFEARLNVELATKLLKENMRSAQKKLAGKTKAPGKPKYDYGYYRAEVVEQGDAYDGQPITIWKPCDPLLGMPMPCYTPHDQRHWQLVREW